ncbi:MAG: hypothetical protein OXG46_04070 [Chloroflexi bacterium]|nr:hypothetical protein [Chloroflexota bacterium]MCY3938662.1 hypothetical protein [Chloroflexota bacterium]
MRSLSELVRCILQQFSEEEFGRNADWVIWSTCRRTRRQMASNLKPICQTFQRRNLYIGKEFVYCLSFLFQPTLEPSWQMRFVY